MIPRKFVSKYGKNLPDLVRLKVPSGAVWQVELVKSNEDILLCNGWKEFTEYYHVKFGHFLVFRYDGNSLFLVLIFDTSASEIEYPHGSTHGGESSVDKADNSVEVLEDFPSYQTRKEIYERDENENDVSIEIMNVPVPNFPSRETVRTNLKCEMENTSSSLQEFLPEDNGSKHPNPRDVKPHCLTREIKNFDFPAENCSQGTSIALRHLKPKQSVTATWKFGALTRARAFKSENPFFMVSMQPSYVCKR